MTRISQRQAKAMGIQVPKSSKYGAVKTTIDGIVFDSKKEAQRYAELKMLERAGEIIKLELHPEFELQPGFRSQDGKWVKPITYIADFRITYKDGRVVVEDVKGMRTKDYAMKKKLLLFKHPDINFVEV